MPDSLVLEYQKGFQLTESRDNPNVVLISGVDGRAVDFERLPNGNIRVKTPAGADISPFALRAARELAESYFNGRDKAA